MSASEPVCLVGWGAIGQRVAALLTECKAPFCIVAVAVRDPGQKREGLPEGARLISAPLDLTHTGASLAVEVAGRASVLPFGRAALAAGMDFAVSSTSAFVDDAVYSELITLAKRQGRQLLVPPGALGGIDALAAASRLGLAYVEHRIVKPARAWLGTPAEQLCDLEGLAAPFAFFEGSAREAADRFPQNANVAVITSLAGIGLERTRITLVADPAAMLNAHEIRAEGDFGTLDIRLQNRPLANNPKSSEMTALNIVRLIENRSAGLML
ncbi:aspartate dehydrogenase [Rhizobium sp. CECT 9324]|uniref:aspartate dehydrogenase n=1 Tax=Rhizobium sp. CECT 9324 TaxID=2845820 RepID=UPI001E5A6A44|nr:aspartate dehydrogenase [Rhizobium sp. CECT 9324]CAH0342426.1 L-aspartate dehydrogenase [Rhizobium sp. CECT 9324]